MFRKRKDKMEQEHMIEKVEESRDKQMEDVEDEKKADFK